MTKAHLLPDIVVAYAAVKCTALQAAALKNGVRIRRDRIVSTEFHYQFFIAVNETMAAFDVGF